MCWKYHVCKNLCSGEVPFKVADWCFWNKSFYAMIHGSGRISRPKLIAKYLGRSVRHLVIANSRTVIANSRIDFFNKEKMLVGYHCHDHNQIRHDRVKTADDFIAVLIRHIPLPQFKMIRYYGAYARRSKRKYRKDLQSSIEQTKLMKYWVELPEKIFKCPYCDGELEFVLYSKKPPLGEVKSQRELLDWVSVNS